MKNDMSVTILEDGTVRIDTGEVGGPEHLAAEKMLAWLAKELGGPTERIRQAAHHAHAHNGVTHTH